MDKSLEILHYLLRVCRGEISGSVLQFQSERTCNVKVAETSKETQYAK